MNHPIIEAVGVEKYYGDHHVLKTIDFTARQGEVTCIIGPSGSGKSTFLRCMNQLESIDGGFILIEGNPVGVKIKGGHVRAQTPREVAAFRQHIGMVFQRFNLFPHMTVIGNVCEAPLRVRNEKKAVVLERATALLKRVGLAGKMNAYPAELSGGSSSV